MAKTPEGRLIEAVNGYLSKPFHSQSMTFGSRSMNGTPDRYYDPIGARRDLWVEWKCLVAMPRDGVVGRVDDKKRGCYRSLQFRWMKRRWENSCLVYPFGDDEDVEPGNVVGIVGLPDRTAVIQRTPTEWEHGSSIKAALPLKEVAAWIEKFTLQGTA